MRFSEKPKCGNSIQSIAVARPHHLIHADESVTLDATKSWSASVNVQSDGNCEKLSPNWYAITTHHYQQPGDYVVAVTHTDEFGVKATGHLHVHVKSSVTTMDQ